ncbi:MAG: DUF1552 domain-containing protein, partial [Planctomycetaceae bacterium]
RPKPTTTEKQPTDIPDKADLIGRTRLLLNLIPLILQTDSSRVISVMIQDHQAVPVVPGVTSEHHNLSHHGQDPVRIGQLKKIETALINCFGNLLGQLKQKSEGAGSLLDSTSVLFGSNLGNANAHDPRNLPVLLAGGPYRHGRYVSFDRDHNTPLCNLFLRMLQTAGVEAESFGSSTGTLTW